MKKINKRKIIFISILLFSTTSFILAARYGYVRDHDAMYDYDSNGSSSSSWKILLAVGIFIIGVAIWDKITGRK